MLADAHKPRCSCIDLDRVKAQFDNFDLDKSGTLQLTGQVNWVGMAWLMLGVIEYNEFENMIQKLLHCPRKSVTRRQECFSIQAFGTAPGQHEWPSEQTKLSRSAHCFSSSFERRQLQSQHTVAISGPLLRMQTWLTATCCKNC